MSSHLLKNLGMISALSFAVAGTANADSSNFFSKFFSDSLNKNQVNSEHSNESADNWANLRPVVDSDFYDNAAPSEAKVALGKALYFDKVISGNMNISCATCHHVLTDTGDGLSLPVGEGGRGLGVMRDTGTGNDAIVERVPRNAPHIFNLGAKHFSVIFHDGRVRLGEDGQIITPAGQNFPQGIENVLAAQAMFPVTSFAEMAGQPGENPVADASAAKNLAGPGGVWEQLAQRLQSIPEYVDMFEAAYSDIQQPEDITFVHAANAIAAFEAKLGRATNTPFDRYLSGDESAMSESAQKGMKLFYGKANCSSCHSGVFQTNNNYYAIAMPQIGGGRGSGFDGLDDYGREQVTGDPADRYRFRTPTLRNVALTAPYGHDGAYNTLEAVVRHHLDPVTAVYNYDQTQAVLTSRDDLDAKDFVVMNDPSRVGEIAAANELAPVSLSDKEFKQLMDFLNALTDPSSIDLRNGMSTHSPSGLPLYD